MARKPRLVELWHFEWLSKAISPVPDIVPEGFFPETEADWQAVITLGSAHLVLPTLYTSLRAKNLWAKVPEEVATALEGFFELNQLHNARLRHQIMDVARTLNAQGINPVWLKGATQLLAADWQQSPRMMLDLDFWLPDQTMYAPALETLGADGYTIPEEYEGLSDTKHHHFLRRMKVGAPAGIEIHRDLVELRAHWLLENKPALQEVKWLNWEGHEIGVLSALDRCIHSYIQCTEMNNNGLILGQVSLMKAHDFVLRYQSLNGGEKESFLARIRNASGIKAAKRFITYLSEFLGMPNPLPANRDLVKRVKANYEPSLWLNPRRMVIEYNASLFYEILRTTGLGPPSSWINKALRRVQQCISYRPEL